MIGGGVALVSTLLSALFCDTLDFLCLILSLPTLPLFPFVEVLSSSPNNLLQVVVPVVTLIVWVVVGFFIGMLVGFVKKKKSSP